jgi:spore germination cell wall hydrolase CwlJ-like protein
MVDSRSANGWSPRGARGWASWSIALALGLVAVAPPTVTALPTMEHSKVVHAVLAHATSSPPEPAAGADTGLTADAAILANQRIPFSREPVLAARPFLMGAVSTADRTRAVDCMTDAIYYEAATEPLEGQRAVAQVVLNRVRHPAFPKSVCGVVFQGAPNPGCQFTFACDGSMRRAPVPALWTRARAVAVAALDGRVMAGVGAATHYHANYVAPYWAGELTKISQIGAHIFYRWNGGRSRQVAYSGHEPVIDLKGAAAPADVKLALAANLQPEEAHAPDDVGGRVELGHGWTPSVPTQSSDALSQVMVVQKQAGGDSAG